MDLTQIKDELFARGARMGFADMEIYYQSNERFEANVFKGAVDRYTLAIEGGLSFRGIYNGKMGYAYAEKVDASSIDHLLHGARSSAEINESTEAQALFAGSPHYEPASFYGDAVGQITPAEQIEKLKQMEAECYRLDPRVANVQDCTGTSFASERMIANTLGLSRTERGNGMAAYAFVLVKEGEEARSALEFVLTRNPAEIDPLAIARAAVGEAVSYLGAQSVESGRYTVLLKNRAAASLLQTFASIFYGQNVQKGKSLLQGKMGQAVGSEALTLIDDPFLEAGAESRTFDAEGVASRRLTLVEQGVIKSYLHNLKSAAVDQVESTGHGYKSSYKGAVGTAPSNLYVQPGRREFGELVESCGEAVVVTHLSGLHSGANPISGDFSLQAHGYLVQGGRIRRPVSQITIGGNFYELMRQVEEVGSDLEFGFPGAGYVGSPTLKIGQLTVAG